MRQKRYIVALTDEERARLERMLTDGKHRAATLTKVTILLKADAAHRDGGCTDFAICEALSLQKNLPQAVRKLFVEQGLERVLTRKKRQTPPVKRIFDGEKEARLIALACSSPPAGRPAGHSNCWRTSWWNCASSRPSALYRAYGAKKSELQPHLKQQWAVPPQANRAFAAPMEICRKSMSVFFFPAGDISNQLTAESERWSARSRHSRCQCRQRVWTGPAT
jgi:hypothetical protein